jgi:hypothetical protein
VQDQGLGAFSPRFGVYDMLGRRVLDLSDRFEGQRGAGHTTLRISKSMLPGPGMYYYEYVVRGVPQVRKMIMMQ